MFSSCSKDAKGPSINASSKTVRIDPEVFATTWKISEDDLDLRLFVDPSFHYEFEVNWGDGSPDEFFDNSNLSSASHTYASPGIYQVQIKGQFGYFGTKGVEDFRLLEIKNWGHIVWEDFTDSFKNARSLKVTATDSPLLASNISMSGMFHGATSLSGNFSRWDVSDVIDMSNMFNGAYNFNSPLTQWDTSNVSNMSGMFKDAVSFNQDLNHWNVSNVTNMSEMFYNAHSFNGNVSSWQVSNVTDMGNMFRSAYKFNQDIKEWDVSKVNNMFHMFYEAYAFNSDITGWDVSKVKNMSYMFIKAYNFVQDLSCWNVTISEPSNFKSLLMTSPNFGGTPGACSYELLSQAPINPAQYPGAFITTWRVLESDLTVSLPLSSTYSYSFRVDWGDGTVEYVNSDNASHTYPEAGHYHIKITGELPYFGFGTCSTSITNVYLIEKMKLVDVKQWGSNSWRSFENAFCNAVNFNVTARDAPDLSLAKSLSKMFSGAVKFDAPVNHWDISTITNINEMFSLTVFNKPLDKWDVSKVINMNGVFNGNKNFNRPLNMWDTKSLNITYGMFANTYFDQPLDNWDTSNILNYQRMFMGNKNFNQPLDSWSFISVNPSGMNEMFYNASRFDKDLSGWFIPNIASEPSNFRTGNTRLISPWQ